MCDPKKITGAVLNPAGIGGVGGVKALVGGPDIPSLKAPKLLDTEKAASSAKDNQLLKALAAYGLSDTKKTGPKGLGSAPPGNLYTTTLLGA